MKWKIAAAATLAAVAVSSAPIAGATPSANGAANGKNGTTSVGKTISAIAKSGGGAAGVLGALSQLKPNNKGLLNALSQVTKPKPTPTPTPTPEPTPAPGA